MTKDSKPVTNTTKETAKSRNRNRVPVARAPETIFDPESESDDKYQDYNEPQHQTMLSVKGAIQYIPILTMMLEYKIS